MHRVAINELPIQGQLKSSLRPSNMATSPAALGTKNDCAGEDQYQSTGTERQIIQHSNHATEWMTGKAWVGFRQGQHRIRSSPVPSPEGIDCISAADVRRGVNLTTRSYLPLRFRIRRRSRQRFKLLLARCLVPMSARTPAILAEVITFSPSGQISRQ
jgi:hypothetical protein